MNYKKVLENKYFEVSVLGLILILAFVLRILYLGFDSMWIDETISAVAAQAILEHGYPLLDSEDTYWRAYLFHYLMAFFIFIFGGDFGARFISVIFGILTVYLGYLFGKKFIGGRFGGFGFALVLAVSSLEIMYSKQARFYQAFQFFYFLSFYLFYKFIILKEKFFSKRIYDYISLCLTLFVAVNLQLMGYIIIPLLILVYIITNFDFKKKWDLLKDKKFWFLGLIGLVFAIYLFDRLVGRLSIDFLWRSLTYSQYYINYYIGYFPLIALSIIGMIMGLWKNFRFHSSLIMYFLIPFIGLFFVKVFATRYAYFIIFPLFFYLIYLFKFIRFKWALFVVMIIFFTPTVFDIDGIKRPNYDSSMPLSDYKSAQQFVDRGYSNYTLVSTWAPAVKWYSSNELEYWVKYSVSGFPNEGWSNDGIEKFTGADVIDSVSDFPDEEFIFIVDRQSEFKMRPIFIDYIEENCTSIEEYYNIKVYLCG